jgi:N-acetylglutamate synthase
MQLELRDFTIGDYEGATALWKTDPNIGLSGADERRNIEKFLVRNPGLSQVVTDACNIIATILCGHDGRRGYIYHLFVDEKYRRQGLGKRMVETCLKKLKNEGIQKCHLFVFNDNTTGKQFWENTRWLERNDITIFSRDV